MEGLCEPEEEVAERGRESRDSSLAVGQTHLVIREGLRGISKTL